MVELTSPCWWRRLARALRARQSSGREVLAAVILAAALLLGYRLTGSKIELSSRLHLWYEEKELWVRLHLRAAPSPPSQSAPAAGYGSGLNPFLATVGTSSGFRPMPFLDFVYEGNSPDINPARSALKIVFSVVAEPKLVGRRSDIRGAALQDEIQETHGA
ncbi:MAG: hypothetical protein ACHQRJ_02165 [Alphaproteobacteria bacterium]